MQVRFASDDVTGVVPAEGLPRIGSGEEWLSAAPTLRSQLSPDGAWSPATVIGSQNDSSSNNSSRYFLSQIGVQRPAQAQLGPPLIVFLSSHACPVAVVLCTFLVRFGTGLLLAMMVIAHSETLFQSIRGAGILEGRTLSWISVRTCKCLAMHLVSLA